MSALEGELRDKRARAEASADALLLAGIERRARWLARALALLTPRGALFAEALPSIAESAGLSPEMTAWALESTLGAFGERALCEWNASLALPSPRARRARPGRLCVVVLAGNVFTAAVRGVALPLLLGMPVLAKTAADDGAFARWLERALHEVDPALSESFQVVTFSAFDSDSTQRLFEGADTVVAYGSDRTLSAIRAQLSPTVSFVGHGHGLGAAFVGRGALASEERAAREAHALAFDVAAYDQRGCMSPLACWVEQGHPVCAERFAELVFEGLAALALRYPRGPLPLDVASAQLSFRGVAAMRGRLFEGDGFAVAYEADGPLRISPGYRNLLVLDVADEQDLRAKLTPLGVHLKCLGIAGVSDLAQLAEQLPPRVAPRLCALGQMQLPRLDALHDGQSAFEGLIRFTETDV